MLNNSICADFIIIGAGIIGLSIARELSNKYPQAKIIVFEKENQIGLHASGRNSGVMHTGIYYKEGSLKAKLCLNGARAMVAYCDEHNLPVSRIGKIILPGKETDLESLRTLHQRALANGTQIELLNSVDLSRLEPDVRADVGMALYSPETSVVDPKFILAHLYKALVEKKVQFYFNSRCSKVDTKQRKMMINDHEFSYGHLFNAAGLYADKLSKACGLDDQYTMIPFKGMYYELDPDSSISINHLIYPVPDMNVPFLGVHFTKSISGKIYIGPTAIPVLGREHYMGFEGIKFKEAFSTVATLGQQYLTNKQGFRFYTHQEIPRFIKSRFVDSARSLIPRLDKKDIFKSIKVGIRAQLFDRHKKELAMDFVVRNTDNETHVLNAVSPAFTSAFSFSKLVVENGADLL